MPRPYVSGVVLMGGTSTAVTVSWLASSTAPLGVWNEAGDGVVALGALLGPEGTAREGGDFSTGLVDRVKPFTLLVWVGAGCIWGSFVV